MKNLDRATFSRNSSEVRISGAKLYARDLLAIPIYGEAGDIVVARGREHPSARGKIRCDRQRAKEVDMLVCDGCGAPAHDHHIRERIERLELATRFRPIHIHTLLIDAAPPARPEDYFYRATKNRSVRSLASTTYFDELLKCTRSAPGAEMEEEAALAEFQRQGLFLTYVIECAAEDQARDILLRRTPALVQRLRFSYKPKFVALLSEPTESLIPALRMTDWGDRLVLDQGKPFRLEVGGQTGEGGQGTGFGERLADAFFRAH